jgi:hypothetical protein
VLIRFSQIGVDVGDQIAHAVERAAPNPLRRDLWSRRWLVSARGSSVVADQLDAEDRSGRVRA